MGECAVRMLPLHLFHPTPSPLLVVVLFRSYTFIVHFFFRVLSCFFFFRSFFTFFSFFLSFCFLKSQRSLRQFVDDGVRMRFRYLCFEKVLISWSIIPNFFHHSSPPLSMLYVIIKHIFLMT